MTKWGSLMLGSWSIERKLTLIIITAAAVAILAASMLLITRHARTSRAQLEDDLQTLARIVADNSQAALSFADAEDATEVLGTLRGKQIIRWAALYRPDGQMLACYRTAGQMEPPTPATDQPEGTQWGRNDVRLVHYLVRNNERVGSLYLVADLGPWRQSITNHLAWASLIALASLVLASLLAARLQHRILARINKVVALADAVAAGDLPERLPVSSGDEVGVLQRSFNEIVSTSREVVRQAQALARGDYSVTIQPRSSKDELGLALVQMTEELRRYHEQSERLNWIKTALSDLNDRMRGEQSLETLTGHILQALAHQVGARVGAIYLAEPEGGLRRGAGLEVEECGQPENVALGEGLVGQAGLSREILLVDLPAEARPVHPSGVGPRLRQSILVPLVREHELMGVLELGTADHFTPEHRELLQTASASIAIALHVARSREKLNELLVQTQRQSEALREQQVALQRSNLELGERNLLLEHQKQEIHRQNDALEHARTDLEHKARELAQASQYKSEFLANVSHELRTPLNSLLILSRLLADNREGNLTAQQVEFAQTIHKSGSDLLTLINDILDLSKVEAGRMDFTVEPTLVRELCAAVEGIFRPLAEQKGLCFQVLIDPGAPRQVNTDGHRVGQILRNLMSNAFKFTPRGEVTLRVLPAARTGQAVAFAVTDTGIGIPADKQELVFAAFQQADGATSREYGGTGLGLTISRELARRLGGDLVLESTPGHGSTFTLLLPEEVVIPPAANASSRPAPDAPPAASIPGPAEGGMRPARPRPTEAPVLNRPRPAHLVPSVAPPRGKLKGRRLLVVDDDMRNAYSLAAVLDREGVACDLVADGDRALAKLASGPSYAGVLMDIMMPGRDGYMTMRAIRSQAGFKDLPIVALTARAMAGDREKCLEAGATDYLPKPVEVDRLLDVLERVLGD